MGCKVSCLQNFTRIFNIELTFCFSRIKKLRWKGPRYLVLVLVKSLASLPIGNPLAVIDQCWNCLRFHRYRVKEQDAAHKRAYIEFIQHLIKNYFPNFSAWKLENNETRDAIVRFLELGF
jgi:hypothetical protein